MTVCEYPLQDLYLAGADDEEIAEKEQDSMELAEPAPVDMNPSWTRVGSLCVKELGRIEHLKESYHTSAYIFPIGFKSVRIWWSHVQPGTRQVYSCEILKGKESPKFRIESLAGDGQKLVIEANTASEAWRRLAKQIDCFERRNRLREPRASEGESQLDFRPFGLSGSHFFGFGHPEVLRKIEHLPSAHRCLKYQFLFRTDVEAIREREDEDFDSKWMTDRTNPYGISQPPLEADAPTPINPSGCARTEPYVEMEGVDFKQYLAGPDPYKAMSERERRYLVYGEDLSLSMGQRYERLKRRRPKCVVKPSQIHAWGLFASELIGKDEMVIEYLGELIRQTVADIREKKYEDDGIGSCYMFRIDENEIVDSTFRGNISRFINHSCDPNCYTRVVTHNGLKKIVVFAKRPIENGEEITYDYKFQSETGEGIPCRCGAYNCAGRLN